METGVGSSDPGVDRAPSRLSVRMLGPLVLARGGASVPMPPSRKVRALLAYLALAPRPVPRSWLCELLWDVPDDPRGELRWCLSKIRRLVDEPGSIRLRTEADAVALDLQDCDVDVLRVGEAEGEDLATSSLDRLRAFADAFTGEFLAGLELDRNPSFATWLAAERRRLRRLEARILEHLVERLPEAEALVLLERWAALSPFDLGVQARLLQVFARLRLYRDGSDHLAGIARLFEAEGLDSSSLRAIWKEARSGHRDVKPAAVPIAPRQAERGEAAGDVGRRASIAVIPFAEDGAAVGARGALGDALVHDIIARLAKLRCLFVIAQGTVFALRDRALGPSEAARVLGVDYLVTGALRRDGSRLGVRVELMETRSGRIVWTDVLSEALDETLLVLDEIGNRIVASVAGEIETVERNRAVLKAPHSLSAWEAHHRGLWHMYRFSKADNEEAMHFFEQAVRLDPTFARAHAGLSFTHFQNAFQGWTERQPEVDRAFEAAGRSLMADDRDPAAHWAMGRALWLRGQNDPCFSELETAVELSPNFAQGLYTIAFVHSQAGDPGTAIIASDQSRALSPFDPMLFGMMGARAMALVRQGRFDEAAEWGVKAAMRPNAHAHIAAIAALSLGLAGRTEEARGYLATIRRSRRSYGIGDFLAAMQFAPDGAALFRAGAQRIGMT
jgi:DNA-binding SARP family transcriptional activator